MARLMDMKSVTPKAKQGQTAKKLGCSNSTLQRYRQNINMISPYRISPNSQKRKQGISNRENDLDRPQTTSNDRKRHQMTSNDFKRPEVTSSDPEVQPIKNKNKLKGGAKIEFNDKDLDEVLHNSTL